MANRRSSMADEIEEAPAILARQAIEVAQPLGQLLSRLRILRGEWWLRPLRLQ